MWSDSWEWACCGQPFSVGSVVDWGLTPVPVGERAFLSGPLGPEIAGGITHCETHHAYGDPLEEPVVVRGRILSITAVYWRRSLRPGDERHAMYPVAGTAVLEPRLTGGGGGEPESEGGPPEGNGGPGFEGYIVDLIPLG